MPSDYCLGLSVANCQINYNGREEEIWRQICSILSRSITKKETQGHFNATSNYLKVHLRPTVQFLFIRFLSTWSIKREISIELDKSGVNKNLTDTTCTLMLLRCKFLNVSFYNRSLEIPWENILRRHPITFQMQSC